MHERQTSPNVLSDSLEEIASDRVGSALTTVGNHEGKSLLVIALAKAPEELYFGMSALHGRLKTLSGPNKVNIGSRNNQKFWCQDTLGPTGFVERAPGIKQARYKITEMGRDISVPVAGLMLDIGEAYEVPLTALLGATQGSPAVTRLKLIREVLENPSEATPARLRRITPDAGRVVFDSLSRSNLIQYKRWDASKDSVEYVLNKPDWPVDRKTTDLTKAVRELFLQDNTLTVDEIYDTLSQKEDTTFYNLTPVRLRYMLNLTLSRYHEYGIISRVSGRAQHEPIKVGFDERQREMWQRILTDIRQLSEGSEAATHLFTRRAHEFAEDPDRVTAAFNRWVTDSSHLKIASGETITSLVETVLSREPTSLAVTDIVEKVQAESGRSLSETQVRKSLRKLVESNQAAMHSGKILRYKATSKD